VLLRDQCLHLRVRRQGPGISRPFVGPDFHRGLAESYRVRRDLLQDALVEAGFRSTASEGADFILADFAPLAEVAAGGGPPPDDTTFSVWRSREVGVTPVPGSNFFREGGGRSLVRFVFSGLQR